MSSTTSLRVASGRASSTRTSRSGTPITPDEPSGRSSSGRRRDARSAPAVPARRADGEVVGCGFAGPSQSPGRGFLSPSVLPDARRRGRRRAPARASSTAHLPCARFDHASALRRRPRRRVARVRDGASASRRSTARSSRSRIVGDEATAGVRTGRSSRRHARGAARAPSRGATTLALEGYADLATAHRSTITLDDWLDEDGATSPEGSFVALAGDEIVGYSGLCRRPDGTRRGRAHRRPPGMAPSWPRRGAQAGRARVGGGERRPRDRTWTQTGNEGMRAPQRAARLRVPQRQHHRPGLDSMRSAP